MSVGLTLVSLEKKKRRVERMGRNNIQRDNRSEFSKTDERYQLIGPRTVANIKKNKYKQTNQKNPTCRPILVTILKTKFRDQILMTAREKKTLHTGS